MHASLPVPGPELDCKIIVGCRPPKPLSCGPISTLSADRSSSTFTRTSHQKAASLPGAAESTTSSLILHATVSLDAERPSRRGQLRGGIGCPFQPDDLVCSAKPEFLEEFRLTAGAGDEIVKPDGIEPVVGLSQGPQGTPARSLALHPKAQHLQLFQAAERRPGEKVAIQFQPPGLFADPAGADLIDADWDAERGHDLEQAGAILRDLDRETLKNATFLAIVV